MNMKTIYLSPHLDDVIFSCGGWIWEQSQQGQDVEIWTVCAADPPPAPLSEFASALHQSWKLDASAVQHRRQEDREACRRVGAEPRHLSFVDCIYRSSSQGEPYYQTPADLFGGLDPREEDLIDEVCTALKELLPPEANLIAPLGIGNHVDHDLTRKAASRLGRPLLFYADYPYAVKAEGVEILGIMDNSQEWQRIEFEISDRGLEAWCQGAGAYVSQISTFWENEQAQEREIRDYAAFLGGMRLWEAVEEDD